MRTHRQRGSRAPTAPAPPDFLGEFRTTLLRGFVDNPPAFIALATSVRYRRLNVLPERFSSRIKLTCRTPHAQAFGAKAQPRVAALAKPAKIRRLIIRLIPVSMVHHQETSRATRLTASRAWNTLLCSVPMGAIADRLRWLAPITATSAHYLRRFGMGASSPSSSSSSTPAKSVI